MREKSYFKRICACVTIIAMCMGIMTVYSFAEGKQKYSHNVNFEMKDPSNSGDIYWTDLEDDGYEFATDTDSARGSFLKLTNSSATLGLSGAEDDIYSLSFDLKFTGTASEDNTLDVYMRNYSGGNVELGFMRVTDNALQFRTNGGGWMGYSTETIDGYCVTVPYEKDKWVNIEYIVDSILGTTKWCVDGEEVATGTTRTGFGIAWANFACAGTRSNYVVGVDNVVTGNYVPNAEIIPVAITVPAGTSYEDALKKLPLCYEAKAGSKMEYIPVSWDKTAGEYNSSVIGSTKIKGKLESDSLSGDNAVVYADVKVIEALPTNLQGKTELTQFTPHQVALSHGYLIKTKTGKYIGIDGGVDWADTPAEQKDDDFLFKYIQEITGQEKPVIDGWFLTHLHGDHVNSFANMLLNHKEDITVKNVYFNFPSKEWFKTSGVEVNETTYNLISNALNTYFDVDDYIGSCTGVQQGDMFTFDDVTFDILMIPDGTEKNMNDTSIVLKMNADGQDTIFLGDLWVDKGNRLATLYGNKLKSDIVQMAHHGQGGVDKNVYELIKPRLCLWPAADWIWEGKWGTLTLTTRAWMKELGVETNIVAGVDGNTTIELPYLYDNAPVINYTDINGRPKGLFKNDIIYLNVKVDSNKEGSLYNDFSILSGLYKDGLLENMVLIDSSDIANKPFELFDLSDKVNEEYKGYEIKTFVWNKSLNVPVCESIVLESSNLDFNDETAILVDSDNFDGKDKAQVYEKWGGVFKEQIAQPVENGWLTANWDPNAGLGYYLRQPYTNAKYSFKYKAESNDDSHVLVSLRTDNHAGGMYGSFTSTGDEAWGIALYLRKAETAGMSIVVANNDSEAMNGITTVYNIPNSGEFDITQSHNMEIYDLDNMIYFYIDGELCAYISLDDLDGDFYNSGKVYSGNGRLLGEFTKKVQKSSNIGFAQRHNKIFIDDFEVYQQQN